MEEKSKKGRREKNNLMKRRKTDRKVGGMKVHQLIPLILGISTFVFLRFLLYLLGILFTVKN